MAPLGLFGIENGGLNLAVNLLVLSLVVVWAALVYWTYSDARRRISDPMLVACATAASLFPFIGTIIYLIVRPPEYLDDIHERDLEIAAAEARLNSVRQHTCPHCDFEIEPSFLRCPSCLRRLKEPCTVCGKPLDPRWKICPYCEAEVGQAPAQPRRRERRVRAPAGQGREAQPQQPRQQPPGQPQRQQPPGQPQRQQPPGQPQRQQPPGQPQRQPPQGQPQRQTQPQPTRQQAPPQRQAQRPPGNDGGTNDGGTAERPATRPPAG
ncbi:MAG TPA: zinc ribbon domain-containing protein [Thermoleophilaceae bacterium]|nr:zinc ribbon domain-containing protein [Thermoleophilaceae bacterium]